MAENLLEATNVYKRYGDYTALNNVSLSIPKGSIFGLLGPNGAGKTSFIRILNQITYPDEGTILFNGEALAPKHIAKIGYLPEERGLYKSMKVGEQALYLAQLKGLSKTEAKEKLTYWFDRLEIGHWWNKKIQELSKGMAQKIQFVVTVLHNPDLLIFDEPFSGFDPINANLIKDEILRLKNQGATVIFSTHRMESVEELCDEIALINKSNKILEGTLVDVKRKFRTHTYEVALEGVNETILMSDVESRGFKIADADFDTLGDEFTCTIQIPQETAPNELLRFLMEKSSVTHFKELIPSVNDIFIKAVNNHNA
ncbi:ABC transporter ATP-binding protein [Neptunitalea lumnitzerae]|uniref:ABC transporter ATP-binding protein n=1 Tax=Neptunitalea lumnitzerae TaxID=2965509 RepID=A0ABQ5MMK2_9FLAO|nr:ABC transporter ATP-binding protein [Neptunitalea sp. Y10]GLB50599.1 ABC transporter ATP-binding protein [Neptunitalea sp. Y10]